MVKEMTGKEANGQDFLRRAKSLYYARESALFSPTPRESRKRESRMKKERRKGRERRREAKRNAGGMPLALSQSRRNFARLDGNWRTEK